MIIFFMGSTRDYVNVVVLALDDSIRGDICYCVAIIKANSVNVLMLGADFYSVSISRD